MAKKVDNLYYFHRCDCARNDFKSNRRGDKSSVFNLQTTNNNYCHSRVGGIYVFVDNFRANRSRVNRMLRFPVMAFLVSSKMSRV